MMPGPDDFLLIVDLQLDFCPGGALAVPDGDAVVPLVNRAGARFEHVLATQDWHPSDHLSFASQHPGIKPLEIVQMPYGAQTLWPDHCIQGSAGARLHPGIELSRVELILRKGFRREIDSYSAFLENDRETPTGLAGYLRERGCRRLYVAGLALDYCVRYTAEDGARLGFEMLVLRDACRAIAGETAAQALASFAQFGVRVLETSNLG